MACKESLVYLAMSYLLSIAPLHQIKSSSGTGHKFQQLLICRAGRLRRLNTGDILALFNRFHLFLAGWCHLLYQIARKPAHPNPTDPTYIVPRLQQGLSRDVQKLIPHLSRMKSSVNGVSSSQITHNGRIQNPQDLNVHAPHPNTKCTDGVCP